MSAIDKAFNFIAPRENKALYNAIDNAFRTSGVLNPLRLQGVDQSRYTYVPNAMTGEIPLLGIYKDPSGNDTYGYGLEIKTKENPGGVTPAKTLQEMELQFRQRLKKDLDFVKNLKDVNGKRLNLDDNQKAALVSLVYNVGQGAFKNSKAYNEGLKVGNMNVFLEEAFDKDKGFTKITSKSTGEKRFNQGLYNRRLEERELFLTAEKQRAEETNPIIETPQIEKEKLENTPVTKSEIFARRAGVIKN
jgi:GH24 family phage-related lysozyme (muramidase)